MADVKKIVQVQFGILGPEEIKQMSVVKVEYPVGLESGTGKPKDGGLLDLRMGTIERGQRCATCFGTSTECPGHFGHIELAKPVFNVGYLSTILKLLRCICHHCGRLLVKLHIEVKIKKKEIQFFLI